MLIKCCDKYINFFFVCEVGYLIMKVMFDCIVDNIENCCIDGGVFVMIGFDILNVVIGN